VRILVEDKIKYTEIMSQIGSKCRK